MVCGALGSSASPAIGSGIITGRGFVEACKSQGERLAANLGVLICKPVAQRIVNTSKVLAFCRAQCRRIANTSRRQKRTMIAGALGIIGFRGLIVCRGIVKTWRNAKTSCR